MISKTMKKIAHTAFWISASATFLPASAHVVLEYQVAAAGASYKATFKVGHGCGASPTRQISVDVPAGMRAAHPMPKPGWTLDVQRDNQAQPATSQGRSAADGVVRITWTAKTEQDMLPSDYYDEFVLVAKAPDQAGTVYWPVRQVCAEGRSDWTEVPRPGQKFSELKSPAAALEILPTVGAAAHHH